MKKSYMKPTLSKESFSMTESVATGCGNVRGVITNSSDPDTCSWSMPGEEVFFNNAPVCEVTDVDSDVYCYHGMSGGAMFAVFRS